MTKIPTHSCCLALLPLLLCACGNICRVGQELSPGESCAVIGSGTFGVRADGCADELPRFRDGESASFGNFLISQSTGSDGKREVTRCATGFAQIGGFRASEILTLSVTYDQASGPGSSEPDHRETGHWRVDALPVTIPWHQVAVQEPRNRLFASIIFGNADGVLRAIDEGANVSEIVDGRDLTGASALVMAASHGDAEIVRMLLDAGADVNHALPGQNLESRYLNGASALTTAAQGTNAEIVRMLVDAGADVNHVLSEQNLESRHLNGASAIVLAAAGGDEEIVRVLVAAGADVNHVVPEQGSGRQFSAGVPALMAAVVGGKAEIVRMLIAAGADVNHVLPEQEFMSRHMTGTSPLIAAVLAGDAEIVRVLVDDGADVNHALPEQGVSHWDKTGASALIFGAAAGHEEIVRVLIAAGANVQYQVPRGPTAGLTALQAARAREHTGVVDLLRKAGAAK